MAKNLGMPTIAEGVETREQLEFLRYIGCDSIQGYLVARPMQVADYETILTEQSVDFRYLSSDHDTEKYSRPVEYWKMTALNMLFERLPVGILVFSAAEDRCRVLYANELFFDMIDFPVDGLETDETRYSAVKIENSDYLQSRIQSALQDENLFHVMLHLKIADQSVIRMRITATVTLGTDNRPLCYAVVSEIAGKGSAEEKMQEEEERYRLLAETTNVAIMDYSIAEDQLIMTIRQSDGSRKEYRFEHFAQRPECDTMIHPKSIPELLAVIEQLKLGQKKATLEYRADYFGTGYLWYRGRYGVVPDAAGHPCRILGKASNIQKEKMEEIRLIARAERDYITGLLNRETITDRIDELLAGKAKNTISAFLLCDIDHFKAVNDTFGHIEGDHLLMLVARVMKQSFRDSDLLGRLGGDELVVFLYNIRDEECVLGKAEHFLEGVRRLSEQLDGKIHPTLSIGISLSPEDGTQFQTLYEKADLALYEAKKNGRNQCRVCMHEKNTE